MGSPDTPDQRDPAKDYGRGIEIYLDKLDELLAAEQGARDTYDPQRLEQQLEHESIYGPQFDKARLGRLEEADPESAAVRKLLGERVLGDLEDPYGLPEDFERELETDIRGRQSLTGNYMGNAAVSAEGLFKGKNAIDLYNRRLANAGTFLSSPTPVQQMSQLPTITPDRPAQYSTGGFAAGPMGVGFGQQAFQNQLQANAAQPNPWATALGGAASGAAAGSAFGPYGAVIGGVVGGAAGYFASDERLKENLEDTGRTHHGFKLWRFNFRGCMERLEGVLAQEIEKVMPHLVLTIPGGIKAVNYDGLGIRMRRVN